MRKCVLIWINFIAYPLVIAEDWPVDFLGIVQSAKTRPWIGYLTAVFAPLAASLVRTLLDESLIGYPFITFFPAVIVVALIATPPAAIFATLFSAILASRLAFDSGGYFVPQSTSAWIGVGLFFFICAAIIALAHNLSLTLLKLDSAKNELAALNFDLENRVVARTDEVTRANEQLIREGAARQEAEEQARQSQKMEAIGQLTGGVAHDFNNMLAIVIGNLDLAKRRIANGDVDIVRFLDNGMDGAKRAAQLTRRLLAFSRKQPLSPAIIDTNQLVRGMEDLFRRTLGERIDIEFVLAGGLWRTKIDPGELESAILNLAVNARDAMPDGGRLTIETMNARLDEAYAASNAEVSEGQYIVVAVTDSGTGMPDDVVNRAFDPFFTTKDVGAGTGLGLSQVHGFVKQSGGHIKIYTELGQGTTIKIYLRREFDALTEQSDNAEKLDTRLPLGSSAEIILVVEDDAAVRQTAVNALRELGYTVNEVASGAEAIQFLEKQPNIALIFTDVVMPGLSGRQLAEVVKVRWGTIPILYTTGYTSNSIVHNGMLDAGVQLLEKPFSLDQLARKVRNVLDKSVA